MFLVQLKELLKHAVSSEVQDSEREEKEPLLELLMADVVLPITRTKNQSHI